MIKLKELTEREFYSINKMEEQFGVQLILKKLIPAAVKDRNRGVRTGIYDGNEIDEKDVIRNLKKMDDKWDFKQYRSDIGHKSFIFGISKRHQLKGDNKQGMLCVGSYNFASGWHWYATDQNTGILQNINEHFSLDKREENESLQYLSKIVIPKFVKRWNETTAYTISEEQIRKNIRKVDEMRPPRYLNVHSNDSVYYTATVPTDSYHFPVGITIKFKITKNGDGDLIVGTESPLIPEHWYKVKPEPQSHISEIDKPNDLRLTKEEEQRGLQFIRSLVLPKVVEIWNKKFKKHKTTPENLSHSLVKKWKHEWPETSGIRDFIVYHTPSPIKTRVFKFTITKDGHGKIIVMWNSEIVYQDAKPQMTFYYDNDNQLKENVERPNINKLEEDEALQFIRKALIPLSVRWWKRNSHLGLSEREVSHKLRKIDNNGKIITYLSDPSATGSGVRSLQLYFYYKIYKDKQNRLMAAWQNSTSGGTLEYFVGDDTIMQDLKESFEIDRITKQDEQYAIFSLGRDLISQILKDQYFRYLDKYPDRYPPRKYPRVTKEQVFQNLKKKRRDIDFVEYESVINDTIYFNFFIAKRNGKLSVGCEGPLNVNVKWYPVKSSSLFQENVQNNFSINKEEEQYAIDFLRKILIPNIADFWNEYSGLSSYLVTSEQIRSTLKKVSHIKLHPRKHDQIVYQVSIGPFNEPRTFSIFKGSDGKIFVNDRGDGTAHQVN